MKRSLLVSLLMVFVVSCGAASRRSDKAFGKSKSPGPVATAQAAHVEKDSKTPTAAAGHEATEEEDEHTVKTSDLPIPPGTAPAAHSPQGVDPMKALGWLKNGNSRFLSGKWRRDGASGKDVVRLSKGQKPHSIVLSCSDSRVPPEVVFDQKLGELFVVRSAGETLDPTTIGSIEYAVEHLGSRLILVMGHTQCGAVQAALGTIGGKDAGSPNLNKLVADIHPRIQAFARGPASLGLEKETWANASGVAKDLLTRSEILKNKVAAGDIQIQTAIYHLSTGAVQFAGK